MKSPITPEVGRVIWYYPSHVEAEAGWNMPQRGAPLAATIAGLVTGKDNPLQEDMVHLSVLDAFGVQHAVQCVRIQVDPQVGCAMWMPYQVEQAKRQAEREAQAQKLTMSPVQVKSDPSLRVQLLTLATHISPEMSHHNNVVEVAKEMEAYVLGKGETS